MSKFYEMYKRILLFKVIKCINIEVISRGNQRSGVQSPLTIANILGCSINIVLGLFWEESDDLKENKRSYGIPDILGIIPIGRGCLKVV